MRMKTRQRLWVFLVAALIVLNGCEAYQPATERECDQAFERGKDLVIEEAMRDNETGYAILDMGIEGVMRGVIDFMDDAEKEKFVRQCMGKVNKMEVRCMLGAEAISEFEGCI